MNLNKENEIALKKILKDFADEETKQWGNKAIENLANEFIKLWITHMFTNGEDYYRNY